jgi:hypothetical protein
MKYTPQTSPEEDILLLKAFDIARREFLSAPEGFGFEMADHHLEQGVRTIWRFKMTQETLPIKEKK